LFEDTQPYTPSGITKALEVYLQSRWIFPTGTTEGNDVIDTTNFIGSIDPFNLEDEPLYTGGTGSLENSSNDNITESHETLNNPDMNINETPQATQDNLKCDNNQISVSARLACEDSPDPEEFLLSIGYYSPSGSGPASASTSRSNSDIIEEYGWPSKVRLHVISCI
jgi:hypothetical protein